MGLTVLKSADIENGFQYRVIDRKTDKEIEGVIWANDETGKYIAYKRTAGNQIQCDDEGNPMLYAKYGKIRFEKMHLGESLKMEVI